MKQANRYIPRCKLRMAAPKATGKQDARYGSGRILMLGIVEEPHPLLQMLGHFGGRRSAVHMFLEGENRDEWD